MSQLEVQGNPLEPEILVGGYGYTSYDAANRPLSVVPSGSGGEHLAPLDGGNLTKWDELSRPTLQSRGDSRLVLVVVENFAAPGIAGSRLNTYLRDELGTVFCVVGEEGNNDPNSPNIPARYLYSPYGEVHIEKALEVREVRFEEADNELNEQVQEIEDPELQSEGALTVTFSAALDASSLWSGVAVERYDGEAWVAVPQQDLLLGYEDALELKVLIGAGWQRGSSYRVRVAGVKDKQGRSLAKAEVFDWQIASEGGNSDFRRRFKVEYESTKAEIDTLGSRFPGGQNHLFQGQWTDPVTGIAYARARWYDGRNAGWLSEDPLLDVDSPNLYAFVGWGPQSSVDPLGRCEIQPLGTEPCNSDAMPYVRAGLIQQARDNYLQWAHDPTRPSSGEPTLSRCNCKKPKCGSFIHSQG